jgi:iron complex transport system substrate-binding protein
VRIVSLLPSATEIAYGLGLAEELVGVTFECDEPARARADKTVVVGGRDTSAMSPGEIEAYVRSQVAAGEDLYTLHADALRGLAPDLVLTQDLCRVCALPAGQVDEALAYLGCSAEVLSLDPHRLADVLETISTIGRHARVEARAAALVDGLRARLAAVERAVAGLRRPRVAVVEWTDPPYSAGHWVPDLITAAGGQPVGAVPGARSVATTWDAVRDSDPEVVLVAPCGFDLEAACQQAAVVAAQVPGTAVWAIDANGLVVRPGPRLVDGVEAIGWLLHPGVVTRPPPGRVAQIR